MTVWLGTGENQAQRAIGWGDGVYKSTDAGKTWKNVGLPNSEHIAKILIDPRDSNTVYVASQGPLFSPGGDRGLYQNHRRRRRPGSPFCRSARTPASPISISTRAIPT